MATQHNNQKAGSLNDHFHPKGKAPSRFTLEVLKQAKAKLPFADKKDFERNSAYSKLIIQVPVRLSLPNRLTTRRSTTTARWAPCSPAMMRVADRATARPVFFTSASTSS